MITIRKMYETDIEEVAAIEKSIFSMPWSADSFRDSIALDHTIYLTAEVDGNIAGYCGMYKMFHEGEIVNVAVAPTYRKHGVAQTMLKELMRLGIEADIDTFLLEVRESNHPARALYEKLGFTQLGVRKNFYEKPVENAVIMWLQYEQTPSTPN